MMWFRAGRVGLEVKFWRWAFFLVKGLSRWFLGVWCLTFVGRVLWGPFMESWGIKPVLIWVFWVSEAAQTSWYVGISTWLRWGPHPNLSTIGGCYLTLECIGNIEGNDFCKRRSIQKWTTIVDSFGHSQKTNMATENSPSSKKEIHLRII